MAIENWTDVDYAQAAIDMLPETVEEIDALMTTHGIDNQWSRLRGRNCPVAQWIAKWTGRSWTVGWYGVYGPEKILVLPDHVHQYIRIADNRVRP